jgi:hypothetical protein
MLLRELEVANAYVYIYITLTPSITFQLKLNFMYNSTLLFCNDISDCEVRR